MTVLDTISTDILWIITAISLLAFVILALALDQLNKQLLQLQRSTPGAVTSVRPYMK